MPGTVKPIPEGYHTVTPYLVVRDANSLIQFMQSAFGGKLVEKLERQDGSIWNAIVQIGDSMVMLGQVPEGAEPLSAMLYLYLNDVDAAYQQALEAGAESIREPRDEFYGDRSCGVKDSNGIQWWMATHVEDVTPEEMQRRAAGLENP